MSLTSKNIFINSFIYMFSGILIRGFSFFLIPLYTTYLSAIDYGIISISTSFINVSSYVVSFSLFSAVIRFYFNYKDDTEKLKRFYGSIVIFIFISSLIFVILGVILQKILCKYIFLGLNFFPIVIINLLSVAFFCQYTVYNNILQSQQKALKSSFINILFFFVTLILNIIFIVILKKGAFGSVIANFIAYLLYTLFFIIDMLRSKQIVFCFDWLLIKRSLKYSIPIIPHNLSTQLTFFLSKLLIGDKTSFKGVGIYSIANQFGGVASIFQEYMDRAYGPWLYSKLESKDDNLKIEVRKVANVFCYILGFLFLGISLFAPDYIILFINRSYFDSWKYIPFIITVVLIKNIYYFYVEILFFYKDASRKLFLSTLISSVINLILTYILIPIFGIYGSIFADIAGMTIRVVIVVYISCKFIDIGLKIIDFIGNIILVLLLVFIGLLPSYFYEFKFFNLYNFMFKCFIIIIYSLIVCFFYKKEVVNTISSIFNCIKYKKKENNE